MKKLLLITLSCIALWSCEKEDNSTKENEVEKPKYDVTFSVANFSQTLAPISSNGKITYGGAIGDTLKNYADNLYYKVFNSSGVLINTIEQTSTSATYGTVTDKLPSGTYTVLLAASKGLLSFTNESYSKMVAYSGNPDNQWRDMFFKRFQLTVATSPISQEVRLDREVGGIEVTLQDAIPSTAKKITVILQNELTFVYANGQTYTAATPKSTDFALTAADYGVKGKKFSAFVANTSAPVSVILRAYDSANSLIVEKTITNVRFYKNQRTLLSGSLFPTTASTATGFTVVVNPLWTAPAAPITF